MDAGYQTAAREAEDAFVERRSRFIGAICPVQTEEDALAFVAKRKKAHWDATHHVYAYVLRQEGIRRYSDDGEPQGTAGMPVLDVLLKEALSDCVVVVTRYFGGILLGGGGLVRAYSHGASLAVAAGGLQVMRLCDIVRLSCSYGQYGCRAAHRGTGGRAGRYDFYRYGGIGLSSAVGANRTFAGGSDGEKRGRVVACCRRTAIFFI